MGIQLASSGWDALKTSKTRFKNRGYCPNLRRVPSLSDEVTSRGAKCWRSARATSSPVPK